MWAGRDATILCDVGEDVRRGAAGDAQGVMMRESQRWLHGIAGRATRIGLCLTVTVSLLAGAGCARGGESAPSETSATEEPAVVASDYLTYVPEGESRTTWAKECTDRHGDVTAYALSELKGWQLETLLLEQGYVWSAQDLTWIKGNGSAALLVRSSGASYLGDEQIAKLDHGALEAVAYRVVTSEYSNTKRAFDALAAKTLTTIDVEHADDTTVAITSGPMGQRMLLVLNESNDVIVLNGFGEGALAAGLLDEMAGRDIGTTIDVAFETLTGRVPANLLDLR